MKLTLVLACGLAGALLAGGCTDIDIDPDPGDPEPGEPEPGGPDPGDPGVSSSLARASFEREVYPTLVQKCAACHQAGGATPGLDFVWPNKDGAYNHILGYPGILGGFMPTAPIARIGTGSIHPGIGYSPAEREALLHWLELERAERGL